MPLTAIIVDDEKLARRGLALRLEALGNVKILAQCQNGQEALVAIAEHSPELVFLDVQMPGLSGFDVIKLLPQEQTPMVVFVTAFDQYALDAFKVHAIDYVLKPIDDDRLKEAVERSIERKQQQHTAQTKEKLIELMIGMTGASAAAVEVMAVTGKADSKSAWPEKLSIKDGSEIQLVPVKDIQWVDAAGDYMCVHASGVTHIMRKTMKELESFLNPELFQRIHRSTIVNVNGIISAKTLNNGEFMLTIEGGAQLKVSRGYRDKIRSLIKLN